MILTQALSAIGWSLPVLLSRFLQEQGFSIVRDDFTNLDALIIVEGHDGRIALAAHLVEADANFTLLHILGHFILGHIEYPQAPSLTMRYEVQCHDRYRLHDARAVEEYDADWWAEGFLIEALWLCGSTESTISHDLRATLEHYLRRRGPFRLVLHRVSSYLHARAPFYTRLRRNRYVHRTISSAYAKLEGSLDAVAHRSAV